MLGTMNSSIALHASAPRSASVTPFDSEFRRSLCAFLDRDLIGRGGISPSQLGCIASGDPGFVRQCIVLGGDVQLDTADAVRTLIGEAPFRGQFCRELERFMELTGTKPWVIGWRSVRNASFVQRLQRGSSPHLSTVDRVRRWMYGQLRGEQRRAVFGAATAEPSFATPRPAGKAPAVNLRARA